MTAEPVGAREQDVGRSHRRHRAPSPETAELLERYQAAMRAELEDVLAEIRPAVGQLTITGAVQRPALEQRRALWDLAIKLGRELGSAIVETAGAPDALKPASVPGSSRRSRQAPRLTVRQRRSLGAE